MPLYRTLEPVSYVNGSGTVTHIVELGVIFSVTEAQAETIPASKIEYVGTGSRTYHAPTARFIVFDNAGTFPLNGSEFHVYLDQSSGKLYRWYESTNAYDAVVGVSTEEIDGAVAAYLAENPIVDTSAGFGMSQTSVVSTNYTASPNDYVLVDATNALTITLPTAPTDLRPITIMVLEGESSVTVATAGGDVLLRDNSGLTSLAVHAGATYAGLSVWQYDPEGFWQLGAATAAPFSTDIVDTTTLGRTLMTADDASEVLALLGGVSEATVSQLLSADWEEPLFDSVTTPVSQTFTNVTEGAVTPFATTATAGSALVVAVFGYRGAAAEFDVTVTHGGEEMIPVGPMAMGNNAAYNAANSSFLQYFITLDSAGPGNVAVSFTSTATATPTIAAVAMSWTGVTNFTAPLINGGSESGTTLEQVVISAAGRTIVQGFSHEPASGSANITGYNQTTRAALNGGGFARAVVGSASGAGTVTFTATRTSGADYAESAFQLIGTLSLSSAVLKLSDTTAFGRSLVNTANAASGRTLLDVPSNATMTAADATKQPKVMTGSCPTAGATAAKTVTLDSPWSAYIPVAGDEFLITFPNGMGASSATLAINGTTARALRSMLGGVSSADFGTEPSGSLLLRFDGTYFRAPITGNNRYAEIAAVDITNPAGTNAGLISGQRAEAAMAAEATATRTLASKTLTNPTITNYTETAFAAGTVTTTATVNLSNGTIQQCTLTASTACTVTLPTATAGKSLTVMVKQAASTGNGTVTFTGVKWGSGGTPTMTATAGKMDIFSFIADGTSWYGSVAQGFTP